jgi:hypothetical protein
MTIRCANSPRRTAAGKALARRPAAWGAGVLFAAAAAASLADAGAATTGRWEGGGRACTGTLEITRQTLAWTSSFSRCAASPYRAEPLKSEGGDYRTLFVLARKSASCPFSVIELRQGRVTNGESSWDAIGYPSRAAWQQEDMRQALACPLTLLP